MEHAQQEGHDSPVREGKAKTDRAYDEAVRYVLREMVAKYGSVALALCTHNRASLEAATASMEQLGIARDNKYVVTAQLKGMVDNLTHAFGNSGLQWPFLMRRRLRRRLALSDAPLRGKLCHRARAQSRGAGRQVAVSSDLIFVEIESSSRPHCTSLSVRRRICVRFVCYL